MVFVVVGLGSMGRRRIRLLKMISDDFIIVGVDNRQDRCEQAKKELSVETRNSLDVALHEFKPDGVIVATSPLSHASIINKSLLLGCNVFTELNLVDDLYEQNIKIAKEMNKVLFLSAPFLYREEVKWIEEQVNGYSGLLNYNYHVGQYLPDWHPWESIKDFFVGDERTNGCRELFAAELPWIIETFGEIDNVDVLSSKNTHLPISYKDNYLLLIKHLNGNKGMLAVDIVSRKAIRNMEIYGEELYIFWDGTPTGLKKYSLAEKKEETILLYDTVDKQEGYASFVIENEYKSELEAFINMIKGKEKARYTFEDDKKVLSLINRIEMVNE